MTTLAHDELDLTAHNDRISQLTRKACEEWNAGQSCRATLDELSTEQDKCAAFGCFKRLRMP